MHHTDDLPFCLLVEDSDEDAETVEQALRQSGINVTLQRVCSGDACMVALNQPAARLPVLILLDLNTPGMDGREALCIIKSDAALTSIPVVVVSTSSNPRDLESCYRTGANAYHVKPMCYPDDVTAMIGLLNYWLTRVTLPGSDRSKP